MDFLSPALDVIAVPARYGRRLIGTFSHYRDLSGEIEKLRLENQKLRQWRQQARWLAQKMAHYQALLNGVEKVGVDFATGRVIADGRSPFEQSMLINIGRLKGVRNGHAVINGEGLVGRTVDVGKHAARLLLISDRNSRVPVYVGSTAVRALMLGDNSAKPRLGFLPPGRTANPGDTVYTSGHGGLFPPGMGVGRIVTSNGILRVAPFARLRELEFVSVLLFKTPVLDTVGQLPQRSGRKR